MTRKTDDDWQYTVMLTCCFGRNVSRSSVALTTVMTSLILRLEAGGSLLVLRYQLTPADHSAKSASFQTAGKSWHRHRIESCPSLSRSEQIQKMKCLAVLAASDQRWCSPPAGKRTLHLAAEESRHGRRVGSDVKVLVSARPNRCGLGVVSQRSECSREGVDRNISSDNRSPPLAHVVEAQLTGVGPEMKETFISRSDGDVNKSCAFNHR